MKKRLYALRIGAVLLWGLCTLATRAENLDSILNVLDTCLVKRAQYEQVYAAQAEQLREEAAQAQTTQEQMKLWGQVCRLEFTRNGEAALDACLKVIALAQVLGDRATELQYRQSQALLYGMCGFPWEGKALLDSLQLTMMHEPQRRGLLYATYYDLYDYFYAYNLPASLTNRNFKFLQSIEDTIRRYVKDPAKLALTFHYSTHKEEEMINLLKAQLERVDVTEKGIVATVISNKYYLMRDIPRRDYYWALAAIYNVRSGRHENEALSRLAQRMTETGDWHRATRYALCAYDAATAFKSRSRQLELAPVLAKVATQLKERETELSRQVDIWQLSTVILLLALTAGGAAIFWRERHAKRHITLLTAQLAQYKTEMATTQEDARLRGEYVSRFLELGLETILKFVQMKNTVLMKLQSGEVERLKKMMKDTTFPDNFQQKSLQRFDIAFLRLYPSFVQDINKLLKPEARIELPDSEILNNELRLPAFMRLGITDSAQIAAILGVSVNTVYFYRTKLRNRAKNRERFEQQVMEGESGKDIES